MEYTVHGLGALEMDQLIELLAGLETIEFK